MYGVYKKLNTITGDEAQGKGKDMVQYINGGLR